MLAKDLFKSAADYYVKYRPPYPDELLNQIVDAFGLDGNGRLLDLGCGPGHLLFALAPWFKKAVGMDPEPEMLAQARALAKERGTEHARWVDGGWEDLTREMGPFRLVTIGAAFHWMRRRSALSRLYPLVQRGGGVAIIDRGSREGDDFHSIVTAVRTRYLGRRRRAGSGFYKKPKLPHEQLAALSRFRVGEKLIAPLERTVTVDEIIGYFYSTSGCSPHVLGDKKDAFERDARAALLTAHPNGLFLERRITEAIVLHKD